jgi:pimeloyl-ACP methyl ester carboxylesterase
MRPLLLIVFAAMLATTSTAGQDWRDPSAHTRSFVGIEQGIALEVLDWGGDGPALIVLAGLGNTAHMFDEFAPHFVDGFHVIGITRRGYGASSRPEAGYDIATLASDLRTALDRLGIRRAILMGHSIAGDELTKFAATFGDRVSALIYLDAAYDRTTGQRPTAPGPDQRTTSADLESVDIYNAFAAHVRHSISGERAACDGGVRCHRPDAAHRDAERDLRPHPRRSGAAGL